MLKKTKVTKCNILVLLIIFDRGWINLTNEFAADITVRQFMNFASNPMNLQIDPKYVEFTFCNITKQKRGSEEIKEHI